MRGTPGASKMIAVAVSCVAMRSAGGSATDIFVGVSGGAFVGGDVLVSDAASSQILAFSSSGAFTRATGRPGPGPGEFARVPVGDVLKVRMMSYRADSAVVFDARRET